MLSQVPAAPARRQTCDSGGGTLTEGDPSSSRGKRHGSRRLYDENGREYRPHLSDKYHPKGHWDVKEPGPNGQWKNYTPDGIEIPKGKIWGVDWEQPAILVITPESYKLQQLFEAKKRQYELSWQIYNLEYDAYKEKWIEWQERKQRLEDFWNPNPSALPDIVIQEIPGEIYQRNSDGTITA